MTRTLTKCQCGRVKPAKERRCKRCPKLGRPRQIISAAAIDRQLALIDALKRRARWAA